MIKRVAVLLLSLASAACGVSKDKYQAKELEAEQYMKKYQEESGKAADLEKKVSALQGKLDATQAQLSQAESAKSQLQAEKGALEKKSAEYEQLAASLKGQITAGQVEISELRGKMTVKLKDKILFPSGSASLSKEGKAALDAVASAFKDLKDKNVIVAGYTDDVRVSSKGPWKDNWDLSTARAASVVRYLQSKSVPPVFLGALGFSEYRPVDTNKTPEGRGQNRRIEIALTAADYVPPTVNLPK
ncbi:MAG TPA: OmpA family protein [Anaeromyxobacteraceae bacterium]|nr:OmpA family protein [Anaeromyxobacteraceae bacterium]